MSKNMSGAHAHPLPCSSVPIPLEELERTREIPAEPDGVDGCEAETPDAAPVQVVAAEETVPVHSCIERSILHEILRRESAERDK